MDPITAREILARHEAAQALGAWAGLIIILAPAWGVAAMLLGNRCAAGLAFALGFFLGPLGLIFAVMIDRRPPCPLCKSRLERGAYLCPACHTRLRWVNRRPVPAGGREADRPLNWFS